MTIIETFPTQCSDFSDKIRSLVGLPTDKLLSGLSSVLGSIREKYRLADDDLPHVSGQGYSRHLLHSDEDGLFSVMLLIWRPGGFSPVHSHWTWCGYVVLDGMLHEDRLRWDIASKQAVVRDCIERVPGDVVVSSPGLHDIHRLGNTCQEIAVSLHVYGVNRDATMTHVNRVLPG
ncbi:cysteine dioxygenase family protein [Trinickia acidisoli]|uniref:cysteine dioxygenase family protein n=1 Tax=Trinickia acidisoli TaxID=2767482 RepID=UPI001A90AD8B|nr:cysteine dioxygenase family protein [Trinickia acidisoli]